MFEVLTELHETIERQMLEELAHLRGHVTAEALMEAIFRFFKATDDSGLLRIVGSGEIDLLYRKLPQEVMQSHFLHDDDMVSGIVELLSLSPKMDTAYFSAAFRSLFICMVYKREAGEENFDETLKLLIRGLVLQLMG